MPRLSEFFQRDPIEWDDYKEFILQALNVHPKDMTHHNKLYKLFTSSLEAITRDNFKTVKLKQRAEALIRNTSVC